MGDMIQERYPVIILAGGSGGPLAEATGVDEKATLPIHGRPMLDWVVNAFRQSPEVASLVVVGSERLDALGCMAHVRKRIAQGMNVVQNLVYAVGYIKARFYKGRSQHPGYVISFCDAVFLTPDIVTETLQAIRDADADIVLHYVEQSTFEAAGLPAERTYIPIGDGRYTGSTVYYVKRFSKVLSSLDKLVEMRGKRKDPQGILRIIGCEGQDFAGIETALSAHLDAQVRILISPHAELGMDVDKPSDLELARRILPRRDRTPRTSEHEHHDTV